MMLGTNVMLVQSRPSCCSAVTELSRQYQRSWWLEREEDVSIFKSLQEGGDGNAEREDSVQDPVGVFAVGDVQTGPETVAPPAEPPAQNAAGRVHRGRTSCDPLRSWRRADTSALPRNWSLARNSSSCQEILVAPSHPASPHLAFRRRHRPP